jgi:tetratricopeptide (TPR) repeat protein
VVVALGSLAVTAAGIAVSLVTSDQWPGRLLPYRRWGWWAVLALGLAAAWLAVWHARRQGRPDSSIPSITAAGSGAVGGRDVSVTGGTGPTAGRDATSIVGGQGQTAEQIVNIFHAPPADTAAGQEAPAPGPVSNLPSRNPNFTGRQELLDQVARNLQVESVAAVVSQPPGGKIAPAEGGVQALAGMGGVGKSQLALEYAHRHAADYHLRWWIPSEEPLAIPTVMAALARRLGLGEQADQEETIAQVVAELSRRDRWLLIFDNAVHPKDLVGYQPSGDGGHVLVTTRTRSWGGIATRLEVGVFDPSEAAGFLQRRTSSGDQVAAEALAKELGELPLALEQAAAFMEQTGLELGEYLEAFRRDREVLLEKGEPVAYGATVDATFRLAIGKVAERSEAAVELLELCAFLAPEAVPHDLLTVIPSASPMALAQVVHDRLAYAETVGVLHGFSLVERDQAGVRVHRLVQAVTRHRLDPDERAAWVARAVILVLDTWPAEASLPAAWPRCGQLLPHALAVADHAEQLVSVPESTSALLIKVGQYLSGRAELVAARATLERALVFAEAALGPEHRNIAVILDNLGLVLSQLGELAEARARHERALALFEAVYGSDHPNVARVLTNLGVVLGELGELPAARVRLERALAIKEAAYGPDHPQVAATLVNLGNVHYQLEELPQARIHQERALAILAVAYEPNHPQIATTLESLGLVLADLGDLAEASSRLERALAIKEAAYGPDHPQVATTLHNLGALLSRLGELPGSRARLERALGIQEAAYGPNHPGVASTLESLGVVLAKLGELAEGRDRLEQALAILEVAYGPDNPQVARTLSNLGSVLWELGELQMAQACDQRARAIQQKLNRSN